MVKGDQQHAFQFGLNAGLLLGGIFSVLLVCVLLPLDISSRLSMSKEGYSEIWELEQHRDVTYAGLLKDAIAMCRQSLLIVPCIKAVTEDPENLLLRASIGSSWRSFGEVMEVEINPLAEDKWHLHCTSLPLSSNIAFDYGKNYENVETWRKEMLTLIAEKQAKSV